MTTERFSAPPRSMPFAPGSVLAGKYKVERLLGAGGMGWVVVATHLQLEQRVALKFMHAEQAIEHPDSVGRFLREARAAARIQSDHVARVSDFGTLENGSPYLVMEYLEGHDLEAELRSRPLPLHVAIDYAMQACEGLAEAHAAGIVHRDLKPGNLFLARRSDGSLRVKLLDFGISKLAPIPGGSEEAAMTSTQALMGSPLYMSPEQLRSSKNVDRRADIWSLGIIIFEMLAGQAPFDGETLPEVCARIMAEPPAGLRELRPELPAALESVLMRCLEKDPQKRFQDVAALAQALAPFGRPEARTAAERIARLVRGREGSQSDARVEPVESSAGALSARRPEPEAPSAAIAVSGIAQTNASFTSGDGGIPRRSSLPRWIVGGGLVALVAAVVIGLVSTRGRRLESPIAPVSPASAPTGVAVATTPAPATPPAATTATAPAASAPATAGAPEASAQPLAPTQVAPRSPAQPATTTAPARPQPRPKPTATTPAATATAAKPASTSGFGGRD
jgi:serine/threonine-protein kinase